LVCLDEHMELGLGVVLGSKALVVGKVLGMACGMVVGDSSHRLN